MLITKNVLIKWGTKNKTWYIEKGYAFTRMGDEFEVKVDDLTNRSNVIVDVMCDSPECDNPYLPSMIWHSYKRSVKEDGKYYCHKCATKLYGGEKKRLSQLKNGLSFEQWCLDNNRKDILNKWDYELNKYKPNEISHKSKIKIYFKCDRGIHKSELKNIKSFTSGFSEISCKYCNSFEQWCIDNNRTDVLDRWDYNLNIKKPSEVAYASNQKYYFKCQKEIHKSELKNISSLTNGIECNILCNQCNSFAQWGINNFGEDFLEKYWDYEKNTINPYTRPKATKSPIIWIKCQENKFHNSYKTKPNIFYNGCRCPVCSSPKGEIKISTILIIKGFKSIYQLEFDSGTYPDKSFISQKTFKNLIGLGNGSLSYDFYLPKYNLLIEYQGEYHDQIIKQYKNEPIELAKARFEQQQEHDRRKKEYALSNKYNFLEIWYWDYDNIETILNEYI